jgi:hypothetical protein
LPDKIHVGTFLLSARSARLFAADIAEYVLPIYEGATPYSTNNQFPRLAIEAAKKAGSGAPVDLATRGRMALEAADGVAYLTNPAAHHAAMAAAVSCTVQTGQFYFSQRISPVTERFSAMGARFHAMWAIEAKENRGDRTYELLPDAPFYRWAWNKLKEYIQLDAQDAISIDQAQDIMSMEGEPKYRAAATIIRRQTIEVLQKMRRMGAPTKNAKELLFECGNDISSEDQATFWVEAASRMAATKKNQTALQALVGAASYDSAKDGFAAWVGIKTKPKRQPKGS